MRQPPDITPRPASRQTLSPAPQRPRHRSETLLGTSREVVIEHRGQDYLLRLTASGKLILTK